MAANLIALPFRPTINLKGGLESGATLEVYATGTLTPVQIFSDAALTNSLENPLSSNGFGVFPDVYYDNSNTIRVILKAADGATLSDTDPYISDENVAAVIAAQAAEDAENAEADRILAQAARDAAVVARTGAESARDLALAYGSADVYATWAALAAVTGMSAGDVAQVVSSDTGTHTDPVVGGTVANAGVFRYSASPAGWERIANLESTVAAASATAAASSATSVLAARLTIGEQLPRSLGFVTINNGGTKITVGNQEVGFTVTSGQSGASNIIAQTMPVPAEIAARFVGVVLGVRSTYTVTANFLTDKPLATTGAIVRATRYDGGSLGNGLGTIVTRSQSGTVLTLENDYTLAGQERAIGNFLQVASSAVANAAHSIQLVSTTIVVKSVPAGVTYTATDVAAAWREYAMMGSIGPVFDEAAPTTTLGNGGATLNNSANLPWGLTIPVSSTGINSNVIAALPIDAASMRLLVNAWIETRVQFDTTATFTRTMLPIFRCRKTDGTFVFLASQTFAIANYAVSPTRRVMVFRTRMLSVDGTEVTLEPGIQISAGSAVSGSAETLTVTDIAMRVVEPVSVTGDGVNSNLRTAEDVNNRITYYRAVTAALQQSAFGAGNSINSVPPAIQLFNGATANGSYGVNVPSGQSGHQTILQYRRPYTGAVAGARVRIQFGFTTSATFTRPLVTQFQVNTAGGTAFRTASVAVRTVGTRRIFTFDYTLQGDEIGLWPYVQINASGLNTSTAESIVLDGYYFYELSAADIGTANDKGAALVLAAARAAASSSAGYDVTVTVKPSGGDYTHPKLALDAITDASISKKYRIAVYPGTYTGYAEWHTKDYVDIVGIGRREEIIISFANATNASAATIRETSTLWLDTISTLENLTIRITNGRYAVHRETNGGRPGITNRMINCVVEHLGNATAVNNDWAIGSQYGVGAGNSPGEIYHDVDCVFRGPGGGFSYHTPNNAPYFDATHVTLEGCTFEATSAGQPDLWIKPIRPGAGDTCRIIGCTLDTILYTAAEWQLSGDTTSTRAAVHVTGYGNTAFTFTNAITSPTVGFDYVPSFTGRM